MKPKQLKIRLSERRFYKLQLYAASKDKTMTAIIEDFLDTLPEAENTTGHSAR
ncbi:MAG: hypothetical protein ACFB2X_23215 [Rivularia sp. (in: cyanobacteria)]